MNVTGEEQAAKEGDVGGVLGHAAAVPAVMAATAGLSKVAPKVPGAAATGLDATSEVLNHPVMKALGKTVDALTFDRLGKIVDAWRKLPEDLRARSANAPFVDPGGPQPTATPEQLNPSLVSPARTLPGQIAPEQVAPNGPIPGVDVRPSLHRIMPDRGLMLAGEVNPGAPLPDAIGPEVAQAKGLTEGAKPISDPASVLAKIPGRAVSQAVSELGPKAPIADVAARATKIMDLLNQGLGGRGLEPNVPLKDQGGVVTPKPVETIPEGHTPVESSAIKSYKYDPATREFETVTQSGSRYIHGDVSPEQAQAFEAAKSKGKAWNDLRQNSTLVAKVVNGKRIPIRPSLSDEDFISPDEWQAGHELDTGVEGTPRQ